MIKTKEELLNHFSNINEMYNNPFMYQTLSNMIDELLEQQLCEDCISRKALIERINEAEENFKADNMESIATGDENPFVDGVLSGVFNIRVMVQQAPSVTPQQTMWIPVSERLPEENIHVLCKFYMGGMAECYHAHDYWHIVGGFRIKIDDVLAWMPLPEPYGGEEE